MTEQARVVSMQAWRVRQNQPPHGSVKLRTPYDEYGDMLAELCRLRGLDDKPKRGADEAFRRIRTAQRLGLEEPTLAQMMQKPS